MKNRERCLKLRVSNVRIKLAELPGGQQTFVNHGPRGQRTEISAARSLGFNPFAEQEKLTFKSVACFGRSEKTLVNRRERSSSGRAENRRVHGDPAPAATTEAAKGGKFLDRCACFILLSGRQEGHPHAKFDGQVDVFLQSAGAEKLLGDRNEQTGAVAAGAVGIHSAAMGQANKSDKSALDNVARAEATQLSDEAHPAGVVVRVAVEARIPHDPLQPRVRPEVQS